MACVGSGQHLSGPRCLRSRLGRTEETRRRSRSRSSGEPRKARSLRVEDRDDGTDRRSRQFRSSLFMGRASGGRLRRPPVTRWSRERRRSIAGLL